MKPSSNTQPGDIQVDHHMKLHARQKPICCPWCGSEKIATVINGMPVFIPELESALDSGGFTGGGCRVADEPAWQCTECYAQFYREDMDSR